MSNIIIIYFTIINIISFFVYAIDKYKALKNKLRIKESKLLLISLLGGFIGSIIAMILFRHKIRSKKFKYIHVLLVVLYIIIIYIKYALK